MLTIFVILWYSRLIAVLITLRTSVPVQSLHWVLVIFTLSINHLLVHLPFIIGFFGDNSQFIWSLINTAPILTECYLKSEWIYILSEEMELEGLFWLVVLFWMSYLLGFWEDMIKTSAIKGRMSVPGSLSRICSCP